LTVARGFAGFILVGDRTDIAQSSFTTPVTCSTVNGTVQCSGGQRTDSAKPTNTLTMTMLTVNEVASAVAAGRLVYDPKLIVAQHNVSVSARATAAPKAQPAAGIQYQSRLPPP
jgi:hypothetical protein